MILCDVIDNRPPPGEWDFAKHSSQILSPINCRQVCLSLADQAVRQGNYRKTKKEGSLPSSFLKKLSTAYPLSFQVAGTY